MNSALAQTQGGIQRLHSQPAGSTKAQTAVNVQTGGHQLVQNTPRFIKLTPLVKF